MEKKKLIILLVTVIAVAITVTLVLVLKKNKPAAVDNCPTLDDIISDNTIFPNGTYTISANVLMPDSPLLAPLPVNITMLQSLGLVVDNSSIIAETNRLSYFFVRLPQVVSSNSTGARAKRQTMNDGSIGIRFGNADTIHVVPLNLTATLNSGLSFVGYLPDHSHMYQLEVRMSNAMCPQGSSGSCSSVSWTPYSVSNSSSGSKANFDNELPVACGSQCDADVNSPCATSCSPCDGDTVSGANTPITRRYKLGTFTSNGLDGVHFLYETYIVHDHVTATYEGSSIFDSGCVGTEGEKTAPISNSLELRVDVEPNCEGTPSTGWYFQLQCSDCKGCNEYKCLDDSKAHCGPNGYLIGYGQYYCNRYYEYYNMFNTKGQAFIDCVRDQLLNYMQNYLSNVIGTVDCNDLNTNAFDSHVPIYYKCGFCDVVCENKIAFGVVLAPEWHAKEAYKESGMEMALCLATWIENDVQIPLGCGY